MLHDSPRPLHETPILDPATRRSGHDSFSSPIPPAQRLEDTRGHTRALADARDDAPQTRSTPDPHLKATKLCHALRVEEEEIEKKKKKKKHTHMAHPIILRLVPGSLLLDFCGRSVQKCTFSSTKDRLGPSPNLFLQMIFALTRPTKRTVVCGRMRQHLDYYDYACWHCFVNDTFPATSIVRHMHAIGMHAQYKAAPKKRLSFHASQEAW